VKKLLALLFAMMLVFGACAADEPEPEPAAEEPAAEEPASGDLTLETRDFFFSPTALTGAAGEEATISISNTGDAPHTFTIEDADIDEELQPGDEVEVSVTFPESGTLDFICRFHVGQGMEGTLTVE
jgi:plastocyanin